MGMWCRVTAMTAVAAGLMLTLAGCGGSERAVVMIEYTLDPEKGLPQGLETVAIRPAELGPATDAKWSDITADMLTQLIEQSRDQFGTDIRVADRVESKKVFEEADLSAAGLTEGGSPAEAKLLGIQAFVVSKINIKEEVNKGKETVISGVDLGVLAGRDWGGGGGGIDTREVDKVQKNVTAQALFKLVDAQTGEVWAVHEDTVTSTEETKPSFLFGSGEGEAGLTPTDRIAGALIERVAREFVAKLMPCRFEHEIRVKSSGNENCQQGVKLLRADMYGEALDSLKAAIAEDPEDHRALFAAGVACEKMGDYDKALEYYRRAVAEKAEEQYIEAKTQLAANIGQIRREG